MVVDDALLSDSEVNASKMLFVLNKRKWLSFVHRATKSLRCGCVHYKYLCMVVHIPGF